MWLITLTIVSMPKVRVVDQGMCNIPAFPLFFSILCTVLGLVKHISKICTQIRYIQYPKAHGQIKDHGQDSFTHILGSRLGSQCTQHFRAIPGVDKSLARDPRTSRLHVRTISLLIYSSLMDIKFMRLLM